MLKTLINKEVFKGQKNEDNVTLSSWKKTKEISNISVSTVSNSLESLESLLK